MMKWVSINVRLVVAWFVLMLLSLMTMVIGAVGVHPTLGVWWCMLLAAIAFFKSVVVMDHYMGLRGVAGWNGGLRFLLFAFLASIAAIRLFS